MSYSFQFNDVFARFGELLYGALLTAELSAGAMVIGLVIGILGALGRVSRVAPLRWLIEAYVEVIRNTPFLVQIFLVFFGLPALGLRLSANQAGLLALIVNLGAYTTEIVRAGIEAVHKSQVEAGLSLALTKLQVFRHVVLIPALEKVYPSLTSQFILLMLASSIVSQISADELTAAANVVASDTFRYFEVYLVVTLMYLVLAGLFWVAFWLIGMGIFTRRRRLGTLL